MNHRFFSLRAWLFLVHLLGVGLMGIASLRAEPMPSVETLSQSEMELSGVPVQCKVTRVNLPKGYKTPPHERDSSGPRYVHKGRVRLESNGIVSEFGPGQVFWEEGPSVTLENISEGEVELISFGVIPKAVKLTRNKK